MYSNSALCSLACSAHAISVFLLGNSGLVPPGTPLGKPGRDEKWLRRSRQGTAVLAVRVCTEGVCRLCPAGATQTLLRKKLAQREVEEERARRGPQQGPTDGEPIPPDSRRRGKDLVPDELTAGDPSDLA